MTVNFIPQIKAPLTDSDVKYILHVSKETVIKLIRILADTDCPSTASYFECNDETETYEVYGIQSSYAKTLIDSALGLCEKEKAQLNAAIQLKLVFDLDANMHNSGVSVIHLNNEWSDLPQINMTWGTAIDLLKEMGLKTPENESDGCLYTAQELSDAAEIVANPTTRIGRHAMNLISMNTWLKASGYQDTKVYLG